MPLLYSANNAFTFTSSFVSPSSLYLYLNNDYTFILSTTLSIPRKINEPLNKPKDINWRGINLDFTKNKLYTAIEVDKAPTGIDISFMKNEQDADMLYIPFRPIPHHAPIYFEAYIKELNHIIASLKIQIS